MGQRFDIQCDKAKPTPQYLQIAKKIRKLIENNGLKAGEALPSERELCALGDASRVTIRKALEKLAQDQFVERRQGVGTFVLPRVSHLGSSLKGFTKNAKNQGQNPQAIWIMKTYGMPTHKEANILGIELGEAVMRLGRVRLFDTEPLAIEQAVLPARLLPDINEIHESVYGALEAKGNRPVKGTQRVKASLATPTEAGLLGIQEKSEVLRIERRTMMADDTPVELTRSTYRGDRYDIIMNLEHNRLVPVG